MTYKIKRTKKQIRERKNLLAREYRKSEKYKDWNKKREKTPARLSYHQKFDRKRSQEPERKKYLSEYVKDFRRKKYCIPKSKWRTE